MTEGPLDPFVNGAGVPSYVLPYEEVPDAEADALLAALGDAIMVGHCDFTAAVAGTPLGNFPVIYFKFHDALMRPLKPIGMLVDVDTMRGFKEQLMKCIDHVTAAAESEGGS